MLNVANLVDGKIDLSTSNRYISEEEAYGKYNHFLCEAGDFVVASSGIKVEYIDKKMGFIEESMLPLCMNTSTIRFKVLDKNQLDIRYFMYYLKSRLFKEQLARHITGSAQLNYGPSHLKKMTMPLIALEKQKEMVAVLDKIQIIISNFQQQLSELDTLIKARFVEMFGTLRANEKEFEIVTIQDVCSLIKDGTHQTPNYIDDKENGYKFLSSKDVMSQKIDWTNIKYIPRELHEKIYSRISPQKNDILMSKNGVNYGVAAVNDTDEIFDIYVSLALLRPTEKINPIFFRCVINNPETKWQFDSSIKGIGVPNLHLGEIKKTKILLPPRSLQNEFAAFVQQIDKLRFGGRKRLTKAKNTKNNNRNTITLERSTLYGK
nr:restriction endonuclease subunit S [Enterococcus cecorum]